MASIALLRVGGAAASRPQIAPRFRSNTSVFHAGGMALAAECSADEEQARAVGVSQARRPPLRDPRASGPRLLFGRDEENLFDFDEPLGPLRVHRFRRRTGMLGTCSRRGVNVHQLVASPRGLPQTAGTLRA